MTRHRWPIAIAIAAAIPLLAGCSTGGPGESVPGGSGTATTSSGVPNAASPAGQVTPVGPAVTLRLADAEDQGRSSQPWIDEFIRKVTADSGGSITIDPIYNAGGGNDEKPGELVVTGQLVAGDYELALEPVRAWSDAGVTSLEALEAPMLVDNDALLMAIAGDPLAQPLLDGMKAQGVVGLSIWPDDLRHPFAWEQNGGPILTASDLKGAKIWALPSKLQTMILAGFGATPIQAGPAEVDAMVADGSLRGAESSFNGIKTLSGTPTGTADIVLYPKYQVLAAEDSAFSRLTSAQQAIVRDAARAARDLAISKHVPDATIAREWCEAGGRVVLAGHDNIETFRAAAAPLLAKLAEDPVASTALAAIRDLKERTPISGAVEACGPAADPDGPWPSVPAGPDLTVIPDGVYSHAVTEAELLAAGVAPDDAHANAGTWTLIVSGAKGTFGGKIDPAAVDFELRGDRVHMHQHVGPSFWDLRWKPDTDGIDLEIVASDWNTAQGALSLNAYWKGLWTKVD